MDVKNLSEVVVLGAKAYKAYSEAMKDGKLDGADLLFVIPLVQAIEPALKDIALVPAEALDLDPAETAQLIELVQKEIPELAAAHDVLVKVRASVSFLLAAKDLYKAFSAKAVGNLAAAKAVNSYEGESEGVARAEARADNMAAQQNLAAAEAKKQEIAAARAPKEAAPVAEPKAAEAAVVAAAEVTPQIPSA